MSRANQDSVRSADTVAKNPSSEIDSTENRAKASAPLQRLAYSVAEAAAVIDISRSKLYELLGSGELQSIKIAGRRLIRHSDLLSLLKLGAE